MAKDTFMAISLAAVLLSGCSSAPRTFSPQLAAAPKDAEAYEAALDACRQQAELAAYAKKNRTGSAVAKGAGGAAVGAMGAGGASYGAAAAAASAGIVAAPLLGIFWGVGRINRGKKEGRYKDIAGDCLAEDGYQVAGWQRVKRSRKVETDPAEAGAEAEIALAAATSDTAD